MLAVVLFVAAVFGTYRAARMWLLEDGPFDVFASLQARLTQRTWVGRGLKCYLCLSVWLALGAAALMATNWRELLLLWGGIAGGSVVLWKWLLATQLERVE